MNAGRRGSDEKKRTRSDLDGKQGSRGAKERPRGEIWWGERRGRKGGERSDENEDEEKNAKREQKR